MMRFLPHTVVWVKPVLKVCFPSSGYGLAKAFKSAEKDQLSFNANVGLPARSSRVVSDSHNPRLVSFGNSHISRVLKLRDISQVFNSVVGSVAVNVVNISTRLFSKHPSPRHSVGSDSIAPIRARFVPVAVYCGKRGLASITGIKHPTFLFWRPHTLLKVLGGHTPPSEVASASVVVKKVANFFNIHCKNLWLILGCNTSNGGVQYVR